MSDNLNEGLKKAMYTGVGIAAVTVDMAGKAIDTLSKKGEEAIQKGKVLNEELKRKKAAVDANIADVADSLEKLGKEEVESIKAKLAEMEAKMKDVKKDAALTSDEIIARLEKMSQEEIESVRTKLEELKKNWTDDNDKGAEV